MSLADRHVGAIRLELALEDGPEARVEVVAALRTHESHGPLPHVELVATGSVDDIEVCTRARRATGSRSTTRSR